MIQSCSSSKICVSRRACGSRTRAGLRMRPAFTVSKRQGRCCVRKCSRKPLSQRFSTPSRRFSRTTSEKWTHASNQASSGGWRSASRQSTTHRTRATSAPFATSHALNASTWSTGLRRPSVTKNHGPAASGRSASITPGVSCRQRQRGPGGSEASSGWGGSASGSSTAGSSPGESPSERRSASSSRRPAPAGPRIR